MVFTSLFPAVVGLRKRKKRERKQNSNKDVQAAAAAAGTTRSLRSPIGSRIPCRRMEKNPLPFMVEHTAS